MLTADANPETEERALAAGAKDFLNKPFKANQIKVRVANLLQTRFLHLELTKHSVGLEQTVRERTLELETARLDIVERLALASEYRDYTTGQHTGRVGTLSAQLARRLGFDATEAELLQRAASLHDIGKIGIPDHVLLKPGKLSAQEWTVMKTHVELGAKLLARGSSQLVQLAETVALTHHERWDGSGYPRGLAGDEIPLVGQIVAVADVFDTLVHQRPYKRAWSVAEAVAEITSQRGKDFSPRVVDVFLECGRDPVCRTALSRRDKSFPPSLFVFTHRRRRTTKDALFSVLFPNACITRVSLSVVFRLEPRNVAQFA